MKKILLFVSIFFSAFAAASERLTLKESGFDAERGIVARLYAKDIHEAKSLQTPSGEPVISVTTIDLNRDGKPEIVARLMHSSFCGSAGCMLVILSVQPNGDWREIAYLISHGDVEVHDDYRNNYRTLTFDRGNKTWAFQNGKYQ